MTANLERDADVSLVRAELLDGVGITVGHPTFAGRLKVRAVYSSTPAANRPAPRVSSRPRAASRAVPRQMTARIGYALALAAATGAPIQVADQLTNQFAVPAQNDLLGRSPATCRSRGRSTTGSRACSGGHPRTA